MNSEILLFDMDGVLLQPGGYQKAMAETVRLVGKSLGYTEVELTPADSATFESLGITSEWDSSAICLVWMMLPLWEREPTLEVPSTLSDSVNLGKVRVDLRWDTLFEKLDQSKTESVDPVFCAEEILSINHHRERSIRKIIRSAHHIEQSLTHRVFQELALGSQVFAHTYALQPWFDKESYLLQYDRPSLTLKQRMHLVNWLDDERHSAAIFTNRPSRHGALSTPEAEIGARCVGLEHLPIVGYGEMLWFSRKRGVDVRALRKPSPLHVLAALLSSKDVDTENALDKAAALTLEGQGDAVWEQFQDAQIYVFEDTIAGINSAHRAAELLSVHGVHSDWHLIGVTEEATKRAALTTAGAMVFNTLADGLSANSIMRESKENTSHYE